MGGATALARKGPPALLMPNSLGHGSRVSLSRDSGTEALMRTVVLRVLGRQH